jgi:hypothetical protein
MRGSSQSQPLVLAASSRLQMQLFGEEFMARPGRNEGHGRGWRVMRHGNWSCEHVRSLTAFFSFLPSFASPARAPCEYGTGPLYMQAPCCLSRREEASDLLCPLYRHRRRTKLFMSLFLVRLLWLHVQFPWLPGRRLHQDHYRSHRFTGFLVAKIAVPKYSVNLEFWTASELVLVALRLVSLCAGVVTPESSGHDLSGSGGSITSTASN